MSSPSQFVTEICSLGTRRVSLEEAHPSKGTNLIQPSYVFLELVISTKNGEEMNSSFFM